MKIVIIKTDRSTQPVGAKETLGVLSIFDSSFTCKTLELPWLNNQSRISCIPAGEYIVKWTLSPLFSKMHGVDIYTYEIQNVPDRGGIRIHAGCFFFNFLGCIGLGSDTKDLNRDGQLDVIHSGDTCKAFNELMNKEDFKLIIS